MADKPTKEQFLQEFYGGVPPLPFGTVVKVRIPAKEQPNKPEDDESDEQWEVVYEKFDAEIVGISRNDPRGREYILLGHDELKAAMIDFGYEYPTLSVNEAMFDILET